MKTITLLLFIVGALGVVACGEEETCHDEHGCPNGGHGGGGTGGSGGSGGSGGTGGM